MAQKSTLDKLPPDVRDYLDQCLQNPVLNLTEVSEEVNNYLVNDLGLQPIITKRIVQRHNANKKKANEELKRHEEVTKQVVKHIGNVSLGNMGKGIAAIVGNIAYQVISEIDVNAESDAEKKPIDKIGMVKDLVLIAKGLNETAAISLSNEAKQEVLEANKHKEKDIPYEELDAIHEENFRIQAEAQARIASRKSREIEGEYSDLSE